MLHPRTGRLLCRRRTHLGEECGPGGVLIGTDGKGVVQQPGAFGKAAFHAGPHISGFAPAVAGMAVPLGLMGGVGLCVAGRAHAQADAGCDGRRRQGVDELGHVGL